MSSGFSITPVKRYRVTYTAYVYATSEDEAGQNMLDCNGDFDTEVVEVDDAGNEVT
jgi:hypothetical protein